MDLTSKLKSPFSGKPVLPSPANARKVAAAFYRSDLVKEHPEWIEVIEYWQNNRTASGRYVSCPFTYKVNEVPHDYELYHDGGDKYKAWRKHTGRLCAGDYHYKVVGTDLDAINEWVIGMYRVWPSAGYGTTFVRMDNTEIDFIVFQGYHAGSCD